MRESIIIYDSWGRLISGLPNEQAAKLCKMIFDYSFIGIIPESDDVTVTAMFSMIKEKLDEDAEAWEKTRKARSEAGKRGNEVRWSNRKESQSDNLQSQNIAKIAVSDSVSVSKDKEKDKKESRRFTPPSREDVQAYITEKGYHVDAEQFIDFYTAKGWLVGKTPMKDWRAAVRTWAKRDSQKKTPPPNAFTNYDQRVDDWDEIEKSLIAN